VEVDPEVMIQVRENFVFFVGLEQFELLRTKLPVNKHFTAFCKICVTLQT
jgi:hypothetical protein